MINKPPATSNQQPATFSIMEFSGSLGDLGLFIPLVLAMTITAGLNIGVILIWAGILNILTGLFFRQPIPVQPMKAMAAVVITEGMVKEELFAAGILIGVILICLSPAANWFSRNIPKAIVRGIQLGVGLKLILKGCVWLKDLSFLGMDSLFVSGLIILGLLVFVNKDKPILLYVFLMGFGIVFVQNADLFQKWQFQWPQFQLFIPTIDHLQSGFLKGTLPQLPLTLLNSVVAVCALSEDYFPGRGIKPQRMTFSVGLMNILSIPFGGIPMCHGSGGLAAQYRFGARTGGSVIMLGVLKIVLGLFLGGFLLQVLVVYPVSVLAPMLMFAGFALAKSVKDIYTNPLDISVALIVACFIIGKNTFVGFLTGLIVYILIRSVQQFYKGE